MGPSRPPGRRGELCLGLLCGGGRLVRSKEPQQPPGLCSVGDLLLSATLHPSLCPGGQLFSNLGPFWAPCWRLKAMVNPFNPF